MAQKEICTYIGYDLGDGETITDIAVLDASQVKQGVQTLFVSMTMPDCNVPGQAIPTAYGIGPDGALVFASSILAEPEDVHDIHINFKRRPSDLLGTLTPARRRELEPLFRKGWPDESLCPEAYTGAMKTFVSSVQTFTNAIFEETNYKQRVAGMAVDSDEIVFCVGHPTRWDDLDVAMYSTILSGSVLGQGTYAGKKSSMHMAAESRAAFLYIRDNNRDKGFKIPRGTSLLLIDVGSSTIDVTATSIDSRNHQFNNGSNYLGARSIDYLIRDWYLAKVYEDPVQWSAFTQLLAMNSTLDQSLTLCCRMAKERVCSSGAGKARISFLDGFPTAKLTKDVLDCLAEQPIAPVLSQYFKIPADAAAAMGDRSWKQLFAGFLQECRSEMQEQNIQISRIVLTGSASKMPFVREIVQSVYKDLGEDSVLMDMDPSRSISMGLSLVGPSNKKSMKFQQDVEKLLETEVPKCVADNVPALADALSQVIRNIVVESVVKPRVAQWRNGTFETLDDMTAAIGRDCSQENLGPRLEDDAVYQKAIRDWMTDRVGVGIAQRLQDICQRYGVNDLSVENLNVMQAPDIHLTGISMGPMDDVLKMITTVLSVIAGVVAAIILPTVLGVIVSILSVISLNLAIALLSLLLNIPGPGWAVIIGIAGVVVFKMVSAGLDGPKEAVAKLLQSANLPRWARSILSDEKVDEELEKADLAGKIKRAILEEKSRDNIAAAVTENLHGQVIKRADEIKYVIESM